MNALHFCPKLALSLSRPNKLNSGHVYESTTFTLKLNSSTFFTNLNPKGRDEDGHTTVIILFLDSSTARSYEIFAETVGSGGNVAEKITIFFT